jgi:hypothetical protein
MQQTTTTTATAADDRAADEVRSQRWLQHRFLHAAERLCHCLMRPASSHSLAVHVVAAAAVVAHGPLLLLPCAACVCLQASQFSRLPTVLLARILQMLPQRVRLASCARVCKSWAEAAAAATIRVYASYGRHECVSALEPWLEQHAGQLVSLTVQVSCFNSAAPFHLPFFKLQQLSRLDLQGVKVLENPAADSGSSNTGAAPGLGKLRELKLHRCKFSHDALLQLAQLSAVTKFELDITSDVHGGLSTQPEDLKCLLHGMSSLKCLSFGRANTADIMPALPAHSLTGLTMNWSELPDSASRLVDLRELRLEGQQRLSPVALASMTLLTQLVLNFCQAAARADNGILGSLAAVRSMRQLQHLEVHDCLGAFLGKTEPHACSALTASSQLTWLAIDTVYGGQPLPATALQHMFPAGKQLPWPRYIAIRTYSNSHDKGLVMTAELSSMFDACPSLTSLDVTRVLTPDADVSTLLKLPQHCQRVAIGGRAFGDETAGVIAQLTQLITLEWAGSQFLGAPPFTYAGLAKLTALHMLDTLHIWEVKLSGDSPHQCNRVLLKTKAGGQVSRKGLHLTLPAELERTTVRKVAARTRCCLDGCV